MAQEKSIPTPKDVLGYPMGTARKLPDWQQVVDYFHTLAAASDRVEVETLGETTQRRPYIAVTVSSSDNLARRDELREILGKLWDPRGLDDDESEQLIETGRPTNFLLCSQHSSEIGACLMSMELASQLARGEDAETHEILDNTITVIVPSHNPDGHQMEVDWYRQWLDTEYEGQPMPWLYHEYVGHDNNRDWFMFTQKETRLYVALHNREHPQMVFDMHQMYRDGARFMVPPFIDPLDPNQDPIIQQGFADLGTYIAARMTAEGLQGVATNIIFDNYSPSLAYGNYHGSVDLLSEAASVRLATPVEVKKKDFNTERGFNPAERTWNHPMPWKGGEWTLAQIVEYDRIAALAFIEHAARNRRQWLRNYLAVNRRTINREDPPFAYLVPEEQTDPGRAHELLETLQTGAVEIQRATASFVADGVRYAAGTAIIDLRQPAGNFAKTLLEIQRYPDLRQYPDGPPKPPYDITGHTLGLQMGVRTIEVKDAFEAQSEPLELSPPTGSMSGAAKHAYLLAGDMNVSYVAANRLLRSGYKLHRSVASIEDPNLAPGAFIVLQRPDPRTELEKITNDLGVSVRALNTRFDERTFTQGLPRIGIYKSWKPNIDEGWMRWILEQYEFEYATLHDNDVKQGNLADRFDTILLPQQKPEDIFEGNKEKNKYDEKYPPEYVGGLGTLGADALRDFVERGGTLVAVDSACEFAVDHLYLPVRNIVRDVKQDDFYCPGSLLRIVVDQEHPLGLGMERDAVAVFVESPVYDLTAEEAGSVVARYAANRPTSSGWILGEERIAGKPAMLEVPVGRGRVVLIGFRVQFRAQARGTYRLLFNSLMRSKQQASRLRFS